MYHDSPSPTQLTAIPKSVDILDNGETSLISLFASLSQDTDTLSVAEIAMERNDAGATYEINDSVESQSYSLKSITSASFLKSRIFSSSSKPL